MAAIQSLKKQLRGVRSTQKLTKAMKTVSTVKFSKLSEKYNSYSKYAAECSDMLRLLGVDKDASCCGDPNAPLAVVVLAGNKGLCGSFNAQIFSYALELISSFSNFVLIPCGKKAIDYFAKRGFSAEKEVIFGDIPTYTETTVLLDELVDWKRNGKISGIHIIYPKYYNMLRQVPTDFEFLLSGNSKGEKEVLYEPDYQTITQSMSKNVLRSMFFELVLETALGVQAATLMTMRSAHETATDYCIRLEGEINRLRQNAVTADVLETSAEWRE